MRFTRCLSLALLTAVAAPAAATPLDVPIGTLIQPQQPFRELPRGASFNVGGVQITVHGTPTLRVYDLMQFGSDPREDGAGLIDWAWPTNAYEPTVIDFRPGVAAVAFRAGDFSGDADGPLTLTAFDCNNAPVATSTRPWASGATAPFAWLEVRGQEICRVAYRSGGDYPGSTFIAAIRFDRDANSRMTEVPVAR